MGNKYLEGIKSHIQCGLAVKSLVNLSRPSRKNILNGLYNCIFGNHLKITIQTKFSRKISYWYFISLRGGNYPFFPLVCSAARHSRLSDQHRHGGAGRIQREFTMCGHGIAGTDHRLEARGWRDHTRGGWSRR